MNMKGLGNLADTGEAMWGAEKLMGDNH